MGDFLRGVLLGLVPPAEGSDAKLILRWRVNISITLGALVMAFMGNCVLAWGLLPAFFPGFALASDVADTKELLRQVRVAQIDNEIFEAHNKECEAIAAKNRDMAVMYESRVQEKLPSYFDLSKHAYQLQRCPNGQ